DAWYFLRWSAYGHVVIIKSAVVIAALALGALAARRARRGDGSHPLLRVESGILASILVLAAVLAALVPGRGQALPAERGTLLPGPSLATAVGPDGPVRVTLSPAGAGPNTLSAFEDPLPGTDADPTPPRSVTASLYCI